MLTAMRLSEWGDDLVESPLVEEERILLGLLPEAHLRCGGAFWIRDEESRTWRLVLILPQVDTLGPTAAYTKLLALKQRRAGEFSKLDLVDVHVIGPNDPVADLVDAWQRRGGAPVPSEQIHASTGSDMVTYSSH